MVKNRDQQGFTIIELLIVIVVVIILAILLVSNLTSVKQKERNTERETDIKALHQQVESYYLQNSRYPTLTNMNDSNFRSTNMKTIEEDNFMDPRGTSANIVAKPQANAYSYSVYASDGSSACDNNTNDCAVYTLTATKEGGGVFEKKNLQ